MKEGDEGSSVVQMPFSRRYPSKTPDLKDLGLTELSKKVDATGRGAKGHYCSRCRGIWYSYFLEAECPVCGNRHG